MFRLICLSAIILLAASYELRGGGCSCSDQQLGMADCVDNDNDGWCVDVDCNDNNNDLNWTDQDNDGYTTCPNGEDPVDCNDVNNDLNWDDVDNDGYSSCAGDPNDFDPGVVPEEKGGGS
ncbi:hypothetical protein KKC88_03165 [Patescibacteria group bacterium]|nr:hypothetical protein [Patescibacteria group bacterium]MBU1673422.1 hypothetical protein [Patescibacteria group bacterium]MBU1963326.1 hypothetical protein [Patescibacteria group bacterium]